MLDRLIEFDQQCLLLLNGSDSLWLDRVFLTFTATATWLPLAAVLVWILLRNSPWRQALLTMFCVALVVLIADRVSSGLCKPLFHRFRPSHEPLLEGLVDIVNGRRGGLYGFISSHAANTFGVATCLALAVRPQKRWLRSLFVATLFGWACLSSYSRIYLGLHYPGDILCGVLFGLLTGYVCYRLYVFLLNRFVPEPSESVRDVDVCIFVIAFALTLLYAFLPLTP